MLNCPRDDGDILYTSIPGEFKSTWDDETPHAFARWIWHILMGRPGLLYDDLEMATFLGLSESGFQKISSKFVGCEYDGLFCTSSRRRWWVSKMQTKVHQLAPQEHSPMALRELGRKLPGIETTDYSKCYSIASSDYIPTVVAYLDDRPDINKRVQARLEDTVPIESDAPLLGFEQRRKFRGASK